MKIKILLLSVFFTLSALFAGAESYWEGAASMSRYGEFPVNGFYGASNSFPLNSVVEVTNPSTGKKAEIIIVNKLDDNNLFLLISKDAAEKLSIKEDEIVSVKARIVKKFTTDESKEKDLSEDPDLNPSAAMVLEESPEEKYLEEEKIPEEKEPEEVPEEELAGRREKDLADYIIETIIISDIPEEKTEEDSEEVIEDDKEEDVEVTAIIVPDDEEPVEEVTEEVTEEISEDELFKKYEPDTVIVPETDDKDSETEEFEEKYVLVPSGPKPPVNGETESTDTVAVPAAIEEEKAEIKEYSSSDLPKDSLERDSFYLQIGAYKDFESADLLAKRINLDYPVFLYKKGENGIYRVMAGPLKNDEKGAALYQVRIKGISDAFIRKGE